ncbi:MAG: hypothetical protein JXR76_08490 [Deltaproteobacteria bacterium]|nr:hypothetical protein [Deltaproteobacteria bacterium]
MDCGNGIVEPGEQCHDGENNGGYGECFEDCYWGIYCGYGRVQEEYEECDDGNCNFGDDCPGTCIIQHE